MVLDRPVTPQMGPGGSWDLHNKMGGFHHRLLGWIQIWDWQHPVLVVPF